MKHPFLYALVLVFLFLCIPDTPLSAQGDPTRVRLAELEQDVRDLSTHVRQLHLEVEALRRENNALRAATRERQDDYVTLQKFESEIRSMNTRLQRDLSRQRSELVEEFAKQIESLADQTQKALQAMARSIEGQPQATPTVRFSDDYPKEGVAYTVRPGDTLSGIARRFNARVSDIQNANRISDPRHLQVGQNLFIPQRDNAE